MRRLQPTPPQQLQRRSPQKRQPTVQTSRIRMQHVACSTSTSRTSGMMQCQQPRHRAVRASATGRTLECSGPTCPQTGKTWCVAAGAAAADDEPDWIRGHVAARKAATATAAEAARKARVTAAQAKAKAAQQRRAARKVRAQCAVWVERVDEF